MIDVPGSLLDELEEIYCESEVVICQAVQARPGCTGLYLRSVKVLL